MDKSAHIVVIAGGISEEREIALRSGTNVHEALLRLGYNNAIFFDFKSQESLTKLIELNKEKVIDLAVLMTHGNFGEDGCIQGFLELAGIPYTGSGVETSAICMNKTRTKDILKANNLPVLKNYSAREIYQRQINVSEPLILKPIAGGSSVGMFKFDRQDQLVDFVSKTPELEAQIDNYFVERFITGVELTASVIEAPEDIKLESKSTALMKSNSRTLISLPLLELRPKNEFYDYEAKYTKGMTDFILPAEINEDLEKKVHNFALKAFELMSCKGFSRVDFMIDSIDNEPYILELNTLPGMTDTSDLPAQAKAAGIDYDQLVDSIIQMSKQQPSDQKQSVQKNLQN